MCLANLSESYYLQELIDEQADLLKEQEAAEDEKKLLHARALKDKAKVLQRYFDENEDRKFDVSSRKLSPEEEDELYIDKDEIEELKREAAGDFRALAKKEVGGAIFEFSLCLMDGYGLTKDMERAELFLLKLAVQDESAEAAYQVDI